MMNAMESSLFHKMLSDMYKVTGEIIEKVCETTTIEELKEDRPDFFEMLKLIENAFQEEDLTFFRAKILFKAYNDLLNSLSNEKLESSLEEDNPFGNIPEEDAKRLELLEIAERVRALINQ